MPKIELTPENIRDLHSIDRYPEIAATVYGIVLQTQLAVENIKNQSELSALLSTQEKYLMSVIKHLPEGDHSIYKVDQVLISICMRALKHVEIYHGNNRSLTISLSATSSDT